MARKKKEYQTSGRNHRDVSFSLLKEAEEYARDGHCVAAVDRYGVAMFRAGLGLAQMVAGHDPDLGDGPYEKSGAVLESIRKCFQAGK